MNNTEIVCLPSMTVDNLATSGNRQPAEWFMDWITGDTDRSDAGISVTGYSALQHCPLWQGVNIIAGDIGQIPVRLVRNEFDDQPNHPAWNILRLRPNYLQSSSVWKETMMQWALIWGNGVSWIIRRGSRPAELIPLRPDCLWPELVGAEGQQEIFYNYTSPTGRLELMIPSTEVVHIQGLTSDGIWGYPLHEIARNCIAHGLALERHGNRIFRNGVRPSGVLKHPGELSNEARINLRKEFQELYGGSHNVGKVIVLQEAMEFQQTQITNIDSQWIEAMKLNRQMAASLLNLPGWKLNATEDSSVRANLEETNADYTQRTLSRWFNRLSEEFGRKLLLVSEWMSDQYRFVWDVDEVLKADVDTLSTVVDRLIKAEVLNRNEGRRKFGLPPYAGGERFGSPAINPQPDRSQTEQTEENGDDSTSENMNLAHRRLLIDRVTHFVDRESLLLRQAAKGAKNFLAWADEFYQGNPPKITELMREVVGSSIEACISVGIPANTAYINLKTYRESRHRQLLELTSTTTADELTQSIEMILADSTAVAAGLLANIVRC